MPTPMIPEGARVLFLKAESPGDSRLVDRPIQHKGYTDRKGHYHAPHEQRHRVRADGLAAKPKVEHAAQVTEKPTGEDMDWSAVDAAVDRHNTSPIGKHYPIESPFGLFDHGLAEGEGPWSKQDVAQAIRKTALHGPKVKRQAAMKELLAANGGRYVGIEAREAREGSHRHALLLPDASHPGKFRYQSYDRRGFYSHSTHDTPEEALEEMVKNGVTIPAHGAIDEMAQTRTWQRGMRAAADIQAHSSGKREYRYALVNRPAGIGAIPKGFSRVEPRPEKGRPHYNTARHGFVVYPHALSMKEVENYELMPIPSEAELDYLADEIALSFKDHAEAAIEMAKDEPGWWRETVAQNVEKIHGRHAPSVPDLDWLAGEALDSLKEIAEHGEILKAMFPPSLPDLLAKASVGRRVVLFFKARLKGDDRTLDLFDQPAEHAGVLVDKKVQHKGYTDKEGHYHAPFQQRHKVRMDGAPQKPQAKAPEEPQEKPPAVDEVKQAAPKAQGAQAAAPPAQADEAGTEFPHKPPLGWNATEIKKMGMVLASYAKPAEWRKNPADITAATAAAAFYARRDMKPYAVVPGNSYMSRVYQVQPLSGDPARVLGMRHPVSVVVVEPAGGTWSMKLDPQPEEKPREAPASIAAVVEAALQPHRVGNEIYTIYRPVNEGEAEQARQKGHLEIGGFSHGVDEAAVRHVLKEHGDEQTERKRGQVAITVSDFALLPEVTDAAKADSVEYGGKTEAGLPVIRYEKRLNGFRVVVEEVRAGRKRLALKTMWKTRVAPRAPSNEDPAPTAEPFHAQSSTGDLSIAQPQEGSTKTENGVTYVLRGGRWHRQEPDAAADSHDDLDPSSPNYRYRDTGYVAGSRKEEASNLLRRAKRGRQRVRATAVDWEELERNPREAKEVITKSHLFGAVDWEALKAGGMEPGAGFLLDRIYAAVGTAPKDDTAQARKDYTLGLESLRDRMERCKTPDQVAKVLDELRQEREGTELNAEESKKYAELTLQHQQALRPQQEYDKEYRRLLGEASLRRDILDKAKNTKQRSPEWAADVKAAEAENVKAWAAAAKYKDDNPQFQGKRRDLGNGWSSNDSDVEWEARKIRNARDLIVTGAELRNAVENPLHRAWNQLGDRFVAVLNNRGAKGSETFRKQVVTAKAGRITDWSWAENAEKTVTEPKGASKESVRFQLLVADKYERTGGRTVAVDSTEALKKAFGLREVQSGNWVLRDLNSAKFHVEHTAEAFADLADLIGAGDRQVAMNGRLALAFGARGKGNAGFNGAARAHYDAVQRIINLTKMGGGGSLAHEWFHAFDNLLKESLGMAADTKDYLTEDPTQLPPGELRNAFVALRAALTEGPHYLAHEVLYTAADVRTAKANIDRQTTYGMPPAALLIRQAKDVHAATQAVDAYYAELLAKYPHKQKSYVANQKDWRRLAAAYYGANPTGGVISVESGPAMSSFQHEAAKLDQAQFGKYWSQPRELAARAFQAWCEDRLQGQGRRNDYLSVKADNRHYPPGEKPFPEGEERTRINAAFDRLMQVVAREDLLTKALGGRPVWLFFKARLKGDDRTLDLFDQPAEHAGALVDKEVQHKGYTDKEGHYHAPFQQRHKVRAGETVSAERQSPSTAPETGPFGPILRQFRHDVRGAIEHLKRLKTGEAVAALHHPEVGDIDLVWGHTTDDPRATGEGLAKLVRWHPEVLADLQGFIDSLHVHQRHKTRIHLTDGKTRRAGVRLDYNGTTKTWLLTAYEVGSEKTGREASGGISAPTGLSDGTILAPPSSVSNESIADSGQARPAAVTASAAQPGDAKQVAGPDGQGGESPAKPRAEIGVDIDAASRERLARRFAHVIAEHYGGGRSAEPGKSAYGFVDDILHKKTEALIDRLDTANRNQISRKFFTEATGVKLGRTQREARAAIRAWTGESESQPNPVDVVRTKVETVRAKLEEAQDNFRAWHTNADEVFAWVDVRLKEGYRLEKEGRSWLFVNTAGRGMNLSKPSAHAKGLREVIAAKLELAVAVAQAAALDKALARPRLLFLKARPKRRKRKVCMDADEFQREHERLVEVLRSPGHADDLREARKQALEVSHGH